MRYHVRQGNLYPDYVCQTGNVEHAAPRCQHLSGQAIGTPITRLLLETLTPLNLKVALAVQQEVTARQAEVDALLSPTSGPRPV